MIYSMTAFGATESVIDDVSLNIEIRSYNSRHLDIALKIPHGFSFLEDRIRKTIAEKITRGRIEIRININIDSSEAFGFEVNVSRAKAYYQALTKLNQELKLDNDIPLELVLKAGDIITPIDTGEDVMERVWPALESSLFQAMDALNEMRKKEGDLIAVDFEERLGFLQDCVEQVERNSDGLLEIYMNRVKERIATLVHGVVEIDPVRISQEAAILADKSDISEEITRVRIHIRQFQNLMSSAEPAGRKLNFLLQEFNREFNTMGSKSANADLSHLIVSAKAEVEKIREQVQNIE